MLSVYASNGVMVEETNLRKVLEIIVKDKSKLSIKKAAIVFENGNIAASTSKFSISKTDMKEIRRAMVTETMESLSYGDITYCVKSRTPHQLVAFNGANYVIISRTDVTYIIVTCSSRQNQDSVAAWIRAIAKKLRERHL